MDEKVQNWLRYADADLGPAIVLHRGRLYAQTVFHLQQAIEKTLKALIVERASVVPLRIHSLPKLVGHLGLQIPREQMLVLQDLTLYYAGCRYPEGLGESALEVEAEEVDRLLTFTKVFIAWLKQRL